MPEKYEHSRAHARVEQMQRAWQARARGAGDRARRFNAILSARAYVWFWPKIGAALTAKYPWVQILCESCGGVNDLDLRMKPRDAEASIRVVLRDVHYPRCDGLGRPRIIGLAQLPDI